MRKFAEEKGMLCVSHNGNIPKIPSAVALHEPHKNSRLRYFILYPQGKHLFKVSIRDTQTTFLENCSRIFVFNFSQVFNHCRYVKKATHTSEYLSVQSQQKKTLGKGVK